MADMDDEFFADIKFEEIEVSGRSIRVPFVYYDFSRISALFTAPISSISKVLPSDFLIPFEYQPQTTIVTFIAYQYRKMEGGPPYNEFGIMVPTIHTEKNLPGLYVTHLPVTTELARWMGVEIYGFPKFIADISFEDGENSCKSQVSMAGENVLSVEVKTMETTFQSREVFTYTVLNDNIVRSLIQFQGFIGTSNDEDGASIQLGDHPIAMEIEALGFDKKPLSYTYSPNMQMILHKPSEFLSM